MAWSLVNHSTAFSTSTNATTPGVSTVGANLIILGVSQGNSSGLNVSDSNGNTWSPLSSQGGQPYCQLFYCYNPVVSGSHTFSTTGADRASIFMAAFSYAVLSPFDQQNTNLTASGTTVQTGSITPGQNNELIVALCGFGIQTTAIAYSSIDQSFILTDSQSSGANAGPWGGAMAYLFQGALAAVNPTFTISQTSRIPASIASFKQGVPGIQYLNSLNIECTSIQVKNEIIAV
jgi:hypothetical protein